MRNPFKLKNEVAEQDSPAVERWGEGIAFEESLTDGSSHGVLEREGEVRTRAAILPALLAAAFVLIFGRLYYVAIANHDYYAEIAKGNRLRVEYLPAPRGAIYDSRGAVLAGSRPTFELVASPLDLPQEEAELERVVAEVAAILQMPPAEIKNLISNEQTRVYESLLVKQDVSREQALIFHERASQLTGFRVVNTPLRDYHDAEAFAHVIGYVGKISPEEYPDRADEGYLFNDSLGKTGLEQEYETYLRGVLGERQVEVDARGVIKKIFGEKTARPGSNLYLNLDAELQKVLYDSLRSRLAQLNRRGAAAVALDPNTGRVLAYLSLPSFNNNLFAAGISGQDYQAIVRDASLPLFNRPIQGIYHPGSSVKPLVASAALEEGVITPRTLVNDQGQIVIPHPYGGPPSYFYNYNRRPLGTIDVRTAIALSSDVFFYMLGGGYGPAEIEGLGIERLAGYYEKFGFGRLLGIDLPGERPGLVPTPAWKAARFPEDPISARWFLGDTYNVSIGQGDLLVTPLQLISATAAVANGGKVYKPQVRERVEDSEGNVLERFNPAVIADLGIDEQYLSLVREGMRRTVTEGTARALSTLPIAAAGKTGTAQFDARNPNRAHAWFTAFAPYENPQIAIVVMVEDGGEGSVAAVPVVREVLDWWARNRHNQ